MPAASLWWRRLVVAGVAAAVLATVVQAVLWRLFTELWPAILWRDARLAAAIVLGPGVLEAAGFDVAVVAVATVVHFVLSLLYAALIGWLVAGRSGRAALLVGALFGVILFFVNMYGFTVFYPWFARTRDAITLAAHVAFGLIAAAAWSASARWPDQ